MKGCPGLLLICMLLAFGAVSCADSGFTPTEYPESETRDTSFVWKRLSSGTTYALNSLSFLDTLHGYCAGDNGTILKTDDGGLSWEEVEHGYAGLDFKDIRVLDQDHIYAAGNTGSGSSIINTNDGGTAWYVLPCVLSTYPECNIRAIHYLSTDCGVMVGLDGLSAKTGSSPGDINKYTILSLYDVSCAVGANRHFAVGEDGIILLSTTCGRTWAPVESGVSVTLMGVHMLTWNTGFAVGAEGVVLRGNHEGWHACQFETTNSLLGVWFADIYSGVVVGSIGTILHTDDRGESWEIEECDTDLNLYDVFFEDLSGFGIAVGDSGSVFKRTRIIE